MEVDHPVFARVYRCVADGLDRRGGGQHRRRLLAGLQGRVIEVGAGHGPNFHYYPGEVDEVVAVEPEPHLRSAAEKAARDTTVPVRVVQGVAGRLPAETAAFDAAVVSLVLCSVPDQAAALAEVRRVLRPGGELRFYEHVRAASPRFARVQGVADLLWPKVFGGCHTSRDTLAAIARAGFVLYEVDRFDFPSSRLPQPASPHVLGRAALPVTEPREGVA